MDYATEIEKIRQELFSLGLTEEKYNELLNLAAEEMMDSALGELQDKDLTVLQNLEKQLLPEITTLEEANKNIDLIFNTAYGEQAEMKKQELLYDYLKDTLEATKKTKDLLTRYQAGDPTAVAAIESQKDSPEVQEIMKYMDQEPSPEQQQSVSDEELEKIIERTAAEAAEEIAKEEFPTNNPISTDDVPSQSPQQTSH